MKKTYVIDTNVFIQAPYATNCFDDNDIVIPLVVLEELDGLKKSDGDKGANARAAVRILESYRVKGDLLAGIATENGGSIRIEKNYVSVSLPQDLPDDKPDNRILMVCKGLSEEFPDKHIVLVTKDIVLRLKAQIIGIKAEDFTTEQISSEDACYTGRIELYIPEDSIKEFKKNGIKSEHLYQTEALNFIRGRSIAKTYLIIDEAQNMTPNQVKGIITRAGEDTKIILLGDPNQIDKPFLDEKTNGLSYAAKYMKGSPLCWQITLSANECERSALALDAVNRL